jgi:hypothetical protein
MRNKIFGGIGMVWGGGILVYSLMSAGGAVGSSAYRSGGTGALFFGVLMAGAGAYTFFKKKS